MTNKERSTAFNIITTLLTRFIFLFGGFIASVLLARLLGPEGKGIVTAIFVVPLLIVSFADMGIRQATAYYVGKGYYKLSEMISSIAFLWLITSILGVIIVFIYFLFGSSDKYSWTILTVALTAIPIKLIEQYAKGVMLGKNQIGTINVSQLLRVLVNIAAILLLVWLLDLGVFGAALVQLVIGLAVAVYYLFHICKYNRIRFKPVSPIPKLLFLKGFSFAAVLFIINLNYRIDIMILDYMVPPEDIGIYSIGTNVAELLWQLPAAVGMVLFAKSANTQISTDAVERSTAILRLVLPIMIITSFLIAIVAPILIQIVYGTEFVEAGNVLRLLLPGVIAITISKVLHPDLAGRGHPLYALRVFVLSLIINVVLNFILIPGYGINGAALASTISYMVAGIGYGFIYARKEKISPKKVFILNKDDVDRVKRIIARFASRSSI